MNEDIKKVLEMAAMLLDTPKYKNDPAIQCLAKEAKKALK